MLIDALPLLAASSLGVWSILWDILVLLSVALLLGTLAVRLGQSAIVGYLIAGVLVGPNAIGWISTQEELFGIAELGVALLLFAIGLEFSPRRLLQFGDTVLKTGPLQVVLTMALGFAVALFCGLGAKEALVIGMMVTLSSTACVLRLLSDRKEIDSQHGRTAIGILLVQDVAVVPMMLLVSIMATGGDWGLIVGKLAIALILAAVLVGSFYVFFNLVAPRLMLLPTWRKNRDFPILLAVIMATGSAWATHAMGLSPAMGAFMAGVLLAISPFAAQVRADTQPLTTLMVTLFFASIGMFGDPGWFFVHWPLVMGIVFAILVGKTLIVAFLARLFGQTWRYAIVSAMCLAQVGEFSFVLGIIAHSNADGAPLITPTTFHAMVSATLLTLLITPYLISGAPLIGLRFGRLMRRWERSHHAPSSPSVPTSAVEGDIPPEESNLERSANLDRILLIGFGPAGQRVAEGLLHSHQQNIVVIDLNHDNIDIAKRYGLAAQYGDATQHEILEHAGIDEAQAVVITVPDHATVRHLIHLVCEMAPQAFVIARCRYHVLHWELISAGAHEVVDEEDEIGRRLAAQVGKHVDNQSDPLDY